MRVNVKCVASLSLELKVVHNIFICQLSFSLKFGFWSFLELDSQRKCLNFLIFLDS